jgi:hypothetical protein
MLSMSRLAGARSRVLSLHARAASTGWEQSWQAAVDKVTGNVGGYDQSAKQLREITKSEVVKFTDLRDDPARFFQAHRTLARRAPVLGPGFWIRFTVSFNLCGGTVRAVVLGSDTRAATRLGWVGNVD